MGERHGARLAQPHRRTLTGSGAVPNGGRELTAGRAALAGPGLVLCGPAGSGRSALAAALAPGAHRVVATAATATQPLWAARHLTASDPGPLEPGALVEHVRAAAGSRRSPVVVVDDVDHLDPSSGAVLLQLLLEGSLRLVGVRRRTRPAPDAVAALWREAGLVRIDVGPLGPDHIATVIGSLLGGPVEGRTLTTLADLAAGSPYLAREVVEGSVASGALATRDGLWCLHGEPTLTADVTDRARSELHGLSSDATAAAEAVAVAGDLPLAAATVAAGAAALEELERRGLLVVTGDPPATTVRLSSTVVARHLTASLPRTSRFRITASLADAARAAGAADEGGPLQLRAAWWDLEAGRDVDGATLLRGARLALEDGDPALAERLAAAAATGDSTEAVLLQSWCADERGDHERSVQVLDAHTPVGPAATVAVAIRRAEQAFWSRHDPDEAGRTLDRAATSTSGPWPLAASAQQGVFDILSGRPGDALTATLPLVDHPEPLVASTAALAAALALAAIDRAEEAAALAGRALDRLGGPTPALYIDPGVHVITLGWAQLAAGRLEEADELTDAVYRHTLGRPGRQAQGWAALLRSRVLIARGRPRAARTVALEAEQVWDGAGLHGLARWSAAAAALAAAEQGDLAALDHDLTRLDTHPAGPFGLFEPEVARARAWRHHLEGRHEDAHLALHEVAGAAIAAGAVALAAATAHDLVRLGDPEGAVGVFDRLAPGSTLTEVRRRLALAAHGAETASPSGLEAVADELDGLGAAGWAAEARALAGLARPSRLPALRAALDAAVADTGLATPPLARLGADAGDRGLTAREQEVVTLAAEGLSNREIADRLVVSLRTVENHLHRAFAKLGVTSRAELAREAGTARP